VDGGPAGEHLLFAVSNGPQEHSEIGILGKMQKGEKIIALYTERSPNKASTLRIRK